MYAAAGREQERHRAGHLGGLADPAERERPRDRVPHRLGQGPHLRRRDHPGHHHVAADAARAPLRGQRLRHARRGRPSRPCRPPARAARSRPTRTRSRRCGRRPTRASASNAARITLNGPVRFVAMSLSHSSREKRSARWIVSTTPAFATTASQPPRRSISSRDARVHGGRVAHVEIGDVASRDRPARALELAPRSPCPRPPSAPVTIARPALSAHGRARTAPSARPGCRPGPCTSTKCTDRGRSRPAACSDRPGSRSTGSAASRS